MSASKVMILLLLMVVFMAVDQHSQSTTTRGADLGRSDEEEGSPFRAR